MSTASPWATLWLIERRIERRQRGVAPSVRAWRGSDVEFYEATFFFGGLTIGKGRFRPQKRDTGKSLRVNDLIRISPIRLIDENNEQVGIVETDDAKRRAREAGLDLVEVAPTAKPPVCRIMDYGKWKYQQRKKEQKAKAHAKQSELKGIRLRPGIDDHDLDFKVNKAREFLDDGDKVQFTMLFRGRQMAHQDLGIQTMEEIYQRLADIAKIEATPRMQGRRMTMTVSPDKRSTKPASKPAGQPPAAGKGEADATGHRSATPPTPQPAAQSAEPSAEQSQASDEA